ncbi:hypothetical protein MMC18_006079 [Xylographa bjoerkii]|nr:hypothetical protein [Xylographa bjoerkii]
MQPTRVDGLTEKDAENLQHIGISDGFESKHDDRTSNSSSEQSDLTAITPKLLALEPEFKTNKDKPLLPQPKSILHKPRDNFSEYPTTIREGVALHPSQPGKKSLQPIENQAEVSIKRQARRLSPATKDSLLPNTDYSSVEVRHRSSRLFDNAQTKTKPAEPILIRAESLYETRRSLASGFRTAYHRLSVIEEDHPPALYSQPPAETAEPKRPHNRPFSRRFVGKPPRYSNGQNPSRYAFWDVTGPKGERFADFIGKASISSFSRVPVFRFLFTLRMPAITRWKPPATPKKPLTARAVNNWMRETDDDPVTHPRVDTFPSIEEGYYYERRTHHVDSMV